MLLHNVEMAEDEEYLLHQFIYVLD